MTYGEHFLGTYEKLQKFRFDPELSIDAENLTREFLDNLVLLPNQFAYVFDASNMNTAYCKDWEKVTGYEDDMVDLKHVINTIHPEDRPFVTWYSENLLPSIVSGQLKMRPLKDIHSISYRIRKRDGGYLKIVRNSSPLILDRKSRMVKMLSLCCELTAHISSTKVTSTFYGDISNDPEFNKYQEVPIYLSSNKLSGREKEVLLHMVKGMNSEQIAEKLFLSTHTIRTHRKNMLRRFELSNTAELIAYSYSNELL